MGRERTTPLHWLSMMAVMRSSAPKGGSRKGAGRPPSTLRSKATCTQVNISLSPSEAAEAHAARGETSLTTFVREGFLAFLKGKSQ